MTDEELLKGWDEFSSKMPKLVADGSMHSSFVFLRIDTLPDGGMVTHSLAYNLTMQTYLGMVAYQLRSLHDYTMRHSTSPANQHGIGRVLNLFNKLFQAKQDIVNKKELN